MKPVIDCTQTHRLNPNTVNERGGGLFATDGAVVSVSNSTITGNATTTIGTGDAGALFAGPRVALTIDSSTVSDNYAYDRGGAIYASAFDDPAGTMVTITNSELANNRALDLGGAINTGAVVTLLIEDSMLTGNSTARDGGAIRSSSFDFDINSYTTILRSTISGNSAGDDGGALGIGSGVVAAIDDTEMTNNYAYDRGGTIYMRGDILDVAPYTPYTSYLTITNSTITGNTAIDDGGGVHTGRQTVTDIDNTRIRDNYAASRGGGLRLSFSDNYPSTFTMTDSVVSGNSSISSGGGLSISQGVVGSVQNTTFDGNSSGSAGAAVVNYSRSTLTLSRTTLSNNVAVSTGGGLDTTNANLMLEQSTVSGNSSTDVGGGVYLNTSFDLSGNYTMSIVGSTIVGNMSAYSGGGLYVGYDTISSLDGSIVSGNSVAMEGPDIYDYDGTLTATYSLVGDESGNKLDEASPDADGNIVGGATGGLADPMLGPLQDNGGQTLTHAPMPGSPVIDAGDVSVLQGTTTDQRGAERVFDGDAIPGARVDMGSVEFGSSVAPTGDFDGNGLWDCDDLNMLVAEIVAGTDNSAFDMNQDGVVTLGDITDGMSGWLRAAGEINLGPGKSYLVGDATLDGTVDGQDFLAWNTNKFTATAKWCSGDFNADGAVDGPDFVLWNTNKFMSSDAPTNGATSAGHESAHVMGAWSLAEEAPDSTDASSEHRVKQAIVEAPVESSHQLSATRPVVLAEAAIGTEDSIAEWKRIATPTESSQPAAIETQLARYQHRLIAGGVRPAMEHVGEDEAEESAAKIAIIDNVFDQLGA